MYSRCYPVVATTGITASDIQLMPQPSPAFAVLWCCPPISFSVFLSSLPLWKVPCRIVLASPVDLETFSYQSNFRPFTVVRRSSWVPTAFVWFCSIPQHLRCGLCMRCQEVCSSISSHLSCLNPSLQFRCQCPRLIKILTWPVIERMSLILQLSVTFLPFQIHLSIQFLPSRLLFAQLYRDFLVLIPRLRPLIQCIWSCWRSRVSRQLSVFGSIGVVGHPLGFYLHTVTFSGGSRNFKTKGRGPHWYPQRNIVSSWWCPAVPWNLASSPFFAF